jgi:TonB family protein
MLVSRPIALLALFSMLSWSQTPEAAIASLTGQRMILPKVGEHAKIKLKRSQVDRIKGNCDVAVLVRQAEWSQAVIRLDLQVVGMAIVIHQKQPVCRTLPSEIAIELSEFAPDDVSQVFQTPEQFLASNGIQFSLPPGTADEIPVKATPSVTKPKPLLRVEGQYTPEARAAKLKGTVIVKLIVGTDGRAHKLRIVHALGLGLDESALSALPFWRFEPAKLLDKAVAMEPIIEMHFDIF